MFEDIKVLIDAVAQMEGGAIYVLLAFLTYKVAVYFSTAGAVVFVSKLFIESLREVLITKKTKIYENEIKLDSKIIGKTKSYSILRDALDVVIERPGNNSEYGYLHESDLTWLLDAVREKRDRTETP